MKYLIKKDKKKRFFFYKKELYVFILKNIIRNICIFSSVRWNTGFKLFCINKKESKTQYNNRCVFTGRQKGILTKFKISRLTFLKLSRLGNLSGVKKFFV